MLKLQFELDTTNKIEPKLLRQRNGKLIVDIQGRLEVLVNDKCFFFEPSLALLEFGIALRKWKREQNFMYYTIEHDEREGPILEFINLGENQWSIFSIWELFECRERLSFEIINEAVDYFLLELDRDLMKIYDIKINDFIKSRCFFEG